MFFTRDCGAEVPLSVDHTATDFAGTPSYQEHLAVSGTPRRNNDDVPHSLVFYRNLLQGADDHSVEILSIGFTQILAVLFPAGQGWMKKPDVTGLFRIRMDNTGM